MMESAVEGIKSVPSVCLCTDQEGNLINLRRVNLRRFYWSNTLRAHLFSSTLALTEAMEAHFFAQESSLTEYCEHSSCAAELEICESNLIPV